jgi:hypothetical protein
MISETVLLTRNVNLAKCYFSSVNYTYTLVSSASTNLGPTNKEVRLISSAPLNIVLYKLSFWICFYNAFKRWRLSMAVNGRPI